MNEVVKTEETGIVVFTEFRAKLAEFKERYDNVVYNLEIPEQLAQAKSDAYSIGKINSKLDAAHKEAKAPHKEKCDELDLARKTLKDDFLLMQSKIKDPIKKREQAIVEHAEWLQEKVDVLRNYGWYDEYGITPDAAQIAEWLGELKQIDVDDTYEDRKADATLAQVETIKKLEGMLAERQKYESEQAELEKLRKEAEQRERADREEKIRRGAEERAKREVEREAQLKIEEARRNELKAEQAVVRANQEKQEAVERAAREERAKIELERQEAVAKAMRERLEDEAKKTDKAHRKKIEYEAVESIRKENELSTDKAELIICSIACGLIKHVSINY